VTLDADQLQHQLLGRRVENATLDVVVNGAEIECAGTRMTCASTSDLLGLAVDPRIREAVQSTLRKTGLRGGSELSLCGEFELLAAKTLGTQAAVVFSSATEFIANLGPVALDDRSEELRSGRAVPCTAETAGTVLAENQLTALVSNAIYPLAGEFASIARYAEVCARARVAIISVDPCGFGVLGASAGGAVDQLRLHDEVELQVAVLGGSVPGAGIVVGGTTRVVNALRGSQPAPPGPLVAASKRAVEILLAEPDRRVRTFEVAARFAEALRSQRFDIGPTVTPWIPVWMGDAALCQQWLAALKECGIFCRGWLAGPRSRLLLSLSATTTDEQVQVILEAFERVRRRLRVPQLSRQFDRVVPMARPGVFALSGPCAPHWHVPAATATSADDGLLTVQSPLGERVSRAIETFTWRATTRLPIVRLPAAATIRSLLARRPRDS
jgi:8-amino-7-oxononanoate synthase